MSLSYGLQFLNVIINPKRLFIITPIILDIQYLSHFLNLVCKIEDLSQECVFPFVYKNITYSYCTKYDTINDKAWCAIYPTEPGGEVAFLTAEHWADCETRCQNVCDKTQDCPVDHFCHYDSHCEIELCTASHDDCGLGMICKVQSWCEHLHGFERCPRQCGMKQSGV